MAEALLSPVNMYVCVYVCATCDCLLRAKSENIIYNIHVTEKEERQGEKRQVRGAGVNLITLHSHAANHTCLLLF